MNTRSVQRNLLASSGLKAMPAGSLGDYQEPGMRIGQEYQVQIPNLMTNDDVPADTCGSVLLWKPTSFLTDHESYL
jgi:hypothetical protein